MNATAPHTRSTAYARHITLEGTSPSLRVRDGNTDRIVGQVDVVRGFAHYTGAMFSAHEGITAVVRGGVDGLRAALAQGLLSGRDDRS